VDAREVRDEKLLTYIKSLRGEYKIGLLSNIGVSSLEKRFSQAELEEYFDAVIVSGEVGYAKPEREIYEITADRLGVDLSECLFTDDRPDYCDAARACGMQAIPYESFVQFQSDLSALLSK
jgi:putative hydrolase of the HAD superfamily